MRKKKRQRKEQQPMSNKANRFCNISIKNSTTAEIYIYGDIVTSKWWSDEFSLDDLREQIDKLPDGLTKLDVRINSNGGEVFAGNAMFNLIDNARKKRGCEVETFIDGIAASMGSVLAMVGDKRTMAQNAMMMIHKPSSVAWGNAEDFRKEANLLDSVEDVLITSYMLHFNGTEDELRAMIADETWLTAEEALSHGFITNITKPMQMTASANGSFIINGVEYCKEYFENVRKTRQDLFAEFSGKEDIMEYKDSLSQHGITNEIFVELNVSAEVIESVINAYKTANPPLTALIESTDSEWEAKYNALQGSTTAYKDKADKYDVLMENARKEAVKSYVKAKGNDVDTTRAEKLLSVFDTVEEVQEQSAEWLKEAEKNIALGVTSVTDTISNVSKTPINFIKRKGQ